VWEFPPRFRSWRSLSCGDSRTGTGTRPIVWDGREGQTPVVWVFSAFPQLAQPVVWVLEVPAHRVPHTTGAPVAPSRESPHDSNDDLRKCREDPHNGELHPVGSPTRWLPAKLFEFCSRKSRATWQKCCISRTRWQKGAAKVDQLASGEPGWQVNRVLLHQNSHNLAAREARGKLFEFCSRKSRSTWQKCCKTRIRWQKSAAKVAQVGSTRPARTPPVRRPPRPHAAGPLN
jgi:hypothetical protein